MPPPVVRVPKYIGRGAFLDVPAYAGNASMALVVNGAGTGYQYVSVALAAHVHAGEDITSGTIADARIASTIARDSEVMPIVLAADGSGSGLDADLLRSVTPSVYGLTLIDDADAATARATLGLGALATAGVPGSTTQVIFNSAGALAGDAGMTYDAANDALAVAGRVVTPVIRPSADSTTAVQMQTATGSLIASINTVSSRLDFNAGHQVSFADTSDSRIVGMGFPTNSSGSSNSYLTLSPITANQGVGLQLSPSANVSNGAVVFLYNTTYSTSNYERASIGVDASNGLELKWQNSGTGSARNITVINQAATKFIVKGGSSPTANMMEWQNSGATALAIVDKNGYIGPGQIASATLTAFLDIAASTTARSGQRIRSGVDPTSPNDGEIWYNSRLKFYRSTTTEIFATGVQATGGALTAGATYGSNEQSMLQKVYDAARTFGLLS